MRAISTALSQVLLLSVVLHSQIQQAQGAEGSTKTNSYVIEYTAEGKTVRTFGVDLTSARFSGNKIASADGTASIMAEDGTTIATGKLQLVSGWMAVGGVKGALFKRFPGFDTEGRVATIEDNNSVKPAVVSLTKEGDWRLEDDQFLFLIDSSYGLKVDFSSSLARNTRILFPPESSVVLWGSRVTTGKEPGQVTVRNGNFTDPNKAKVERLWTVTEIAAVCKTEIKAGSPMGRLTKKADKGKKLLEIIGTFSNFDQPAINPKSVLVVPPLPKDKAQEGDGTKWVLVGVGLAADKETHLYHLFGTTNTGFAELSLPAGDGFKVGREKEQDPYSFTLKKSPSTICLVFEIPEETEGPVSLHFAGTVIPITIDPLSKDSKEK